MAIFDTALETRLHKHSIVSCLILSVWCLRSVRRLCSLDDEFLAIVPRLTGVVAALVRVIRELYDSAALGVESRGSWLLLFSVVGHVRSGAGGGSGR